MLRYPIGVALSPMNAVYPVGVALSPMNAALPRRRSSIPHECCVIPVGAALSPTHATRKITQADIAVVLDAEPVQVYIPFMAEGTVLLHIHPRFGRDASIKLLLWPFDLRYVEYVVTEATKKARFGMSVARVWADRRSV